MQVLNLVQSILVAWTCFDKPLTCLKLVFDGFFTRFAYQALPKLDDWCWKRPKSLIWLLVETPLEKHATVSWNDHPCCWNTSFFTKLGRVWVFKIQSQSNRKLRLEHEKMHQTAFGRFNRFHGRPLNAPLAGAGNHDPSPPEAGCACFYSTAPKMRWDAMNFLMDDLNKLD